MDRAYKYKLRPTEEQKLFLEKSFGCARFIYNWALNRKKDAWEKEQKNLSCFELYAEISALCKTEEYSWLSEISSVSLRYACKNMCMAYDNFFRRVKKGEKPGFPKFKSKKFSTPTVKFAAGTKIDFNRWKVQIPKIGWTDICLGRDFDQSKWRIMNATVHRDHCNTYWISIIVRSDDVQLPEKVKIDRKNSVGIDLGLKDFAVLSTGEHIANPRFIEEEEKHLAHLQKVLSRRDKGNWKKGIEPSKRFERQRIKVAKLQRKIADQRRDFEHKLSKRLIDENGTICIEDLNVKDMMQNDRLAKNIASVSWNEFTNMLAYKCDWYGKNLIKADRWDASSQVCSKCGYKNEKVKNLNVRRWVCPQCGTVHDRDENAANNIIDMAIKKIS